MHGDWIQVQRLLPGYLWDNLAFLSPGLQRVIFSAFTASRRDGHSRIILNKIFQPLSSK